MSPVLGKVLRVPIQAEAAKVIETLSQELAQVTAERDALLEANHSAAICARHTAEFMGDGCLVCDRDAAESARDRITAKHSHGFGKQADGTWAVCLGVHETGEVEWLDGLVEPQVHAAIAAERDVLKEKVDELRKSGSALAIDANRILDRQLGGSYEDDLRVSLNKFNDVLKGAK